MAGAEYIFNVNSTGQTSFYDALTTRPDLKLIRAVEEGLAVSMAHGYELASGRPGMLMLPGIGMPNALSNLYNAWKDRSALVVFSDGPNTRISGRDGIQQIDDWLSMTASFTKWQSAIDRADRIAELAFEAIRIARTQVYGPVYMRIPSDVMSAGGIKTMIDPGSISKFDAPLDPDPELIERAARLLIASRSPLINAGAEVTRSGANEDVVELAELMSISVTQGHSVYCDFPYRHPLFAGFCSMGNPLSLLNTDTLLNLGAPMPGPSIVTTEVPDSARVIDVRIDRENTADIPPADVQIAGSVRQTTRALIDAISGMTTAAQRENLRRDRFASAQKSAAEAVDRLRRRANSAWNASPILAERVCHELDGLLDDTALVVVETGDRTAQSWMDFGPGRKTLIGPTTGLALGWGAGAALGVKVVRPDDQVVALIGDGAFLFGQIESLWTAARYDIAVTFVVFNNRSYDAERGRIHFASPIARNSSESWRDMSCYLGDPNIDFVAIARGFDIEGRAITQPGELQAAFKHALAVNREGRPFLIDAAIAQRGPGANRNWHPGLSIGRSKPEE